MANEADFTFTVAVTNAIGVMIAFVAAHLEDYAQPIGVNACGSDRRRGNRWVGDCLADPVQLYTKSRLQESAFRSLVKWLVDNGMGNSRSISVEEKLLILLYICGQGSSFRHVKYRSSHPLSTISR